MLVQDVDFYDSILDTVLNNEVSKIGGRDMIKIGSQNVDFAPTFELILFTKNPKIKISDNLSSKVTVINFSVTKGSLRYILKKRF